MTIQEKETRYNGIRFRSRLEARWAVLFDALGIQYQYEPEKFEIGLKSGYIPDFFLPGDTFAGLPRGTFVEVKGADPDGEAEDKAFRLYRTTKISTVIVNGDSFASGWDYFYYSEKLTRRFNCLLSQCPFCGLLGFSIEDQDVPGDFQQFNHKCRDEREFAKAFGIDRFFLSYAEPNTWKGTASQSPMLLCARELARSMRFEDPAFVEFQKATKALIDRLRENCVFSHPSLMARLSAFAKASELSSDVPRYDTNEVIA